MSISVIITAAAIAAVIVGGLGILIGFFLGFAGEKFKVEVDPREDEIMEVLPGNNCGGCGYAGCSGLAVAIVNGEAEANACPVGGAPVAEKIAGIMGVEATAAVRMTAFVKCGGTNRTAKNDYVYYGEEDCAMQKFVPGGGPKSCNYGCLGFGSCVRACPFDAIHITDGVAVVDKDACKACSKCVTTCPKDLIELVPYDSDYMVQCNSKDKGKEVTAVCSVGCIACRLCEKNCPEDAITVTENIAHIDQEKCTGCGICAEKCPKKIITLH